MIIEELPATAPKYKNDSGVGEFARRSRKGEISAGTKEQTGALICLYHLQF